MVKHLWFLCTDYESLWPCWVRSTLLRGKSIWEVRCPGDCSWSWRKILGLRSLVRNHMRVCIGDGRQASLWFDYWHPVGPLVQIYGDRLIYDTGVGRAARVAELVEGHDWVWPPASSPAWLEIIQATPPSFRPHSGRGDTWQWDGVSCGPFSIRRAWETLRRRHPVVGWWKVVWHAKAIPRHSFILWLAIRSALYTQDKLFQYGMISGVQCVFCGRDREDLDHLFFGCTFSERLWRALCAKSAVPWTPMAWNDSVGFMQQFYGCSLRSWVVRLMFAAAVYAIWRERNARMHGESPRPERVVLREVIFSVSARLQVLRGVVSSPENRWLQRSWDLPEDMFQ